MAPSGERAIFCCAAVSVFFFNDTATTEIYTLSQHDAFPIYTDPTTGLTDASVRTFESIRNLSLNAFNCPYVPPKGTKLLEGMYWTSVRSSRPERSIK